MHRKTMIAVLAAAAATATAAWAASPADTISARQANFKQMGRAFKGVTDQLKQSSPDIATIRSNADIIVQSAGKVYGGFPKGTGPDTGVKTAALPIIWTDNHQFHDRANQLVGAARNLQRAAASGNLDAVKAGVQGLGGACKACHDTFKGKS